MLIHTLWNHLKDSFSGDKKDIVRSALSNLQPEQFVFTKSLLKSGNFADGLLVIIKDDKKSFLRAQKNENLIYELASGAGAVSKENGVLLKKFADALKRAMGVNLDYWGTRYAGVKEVQDFLIHFLCHPNMKFNFDSNRDSLKKWCEKDLSKDY